MDALARRIGQLAVAGAVASVALAVAVPAPSEAARCFLLFQCPDPQEAAPADPVPSPPPLPVPPSPIPVPPSGPPAPAPPGNPRCEPRPLPRVRWRVGAGDVVSSDPRDRRCTLAAMAAGGAEIVRSSFLWSQVEREGRFDLAFYDRYVEQLARYRLVVMPVLFGTPARYSAAPSARHPDRFQPRHNREFARFAAVLARRYGPGGSFWRSHPRLPRKPIRSWQIWNEPNVSFYWTPRPDARRYARMLAAAARAIERVDPRAEIVAGGMPESRFGAPVARYLRDLYRGGGRRWFDSIALHIYARSVADGLAIVERARAVMDAHADRRARIWVTEFGWASAGPRHRFRVGERTQAANTRRTLRALWRRRARLRLRGAIYSFWRDPPRYRSDFWGLHVGLHRRDGRPKPAASAFRRTVRGLR